MQDAGFKGNLIMARYYQPSQILTELGCLDKLGDYAKVWGKRALHRVVFSVDRQRPREPIDRENLNLEEP